MSEHFGILGIKRIKEKFFSGFQKMQGTQNVPLTL